MLETFIVELVQEIPGAAQYELEILSDTFNFTVLKQEKNIALLSGDHEPLRNAAFVRRVSRVIGEFEIFQDIANLELPDGKFYVRFQDIGKCHNALIEPEIGKALSAYGRVSFKDPDFVIRAYHWDKWYISKEVFAQTAEDFNVRRAPLRPFFSPISIHPRLARFMVNVSRTKPGDTIFDPFCGTGGILLEAGLTGKKVLGNDWSLQMATGARLNLKYFGIRDFTIHNHDFLSLKIENGIDAVVTDLPYGRNAPVSEKDIMALYEKSFTKFQSLLKRGGRCVVVASSASLPNIVEDYFCTERILKYRVHRSLTRYFIVLVKK